MPEAVDVQRATAIAVAAVGNDSAGQGYKEAGGWGQEGGREVRFQAAVTTNQGDCTQHARVRRDARDLDESFVRSLSELDSRAH